MRNVSAACQCRLVVLIALFCLIVSCASFEKTIEDSTQLHQELASGNKSVVMGRIEWIFGGKEKTFSKGIFGSDMTPQLVRIEDRARINYSITETGHFVWMLDPGTYVINKIEYRDQWSGSYFIVPQVGFSVPEKGQRYYIGNLRIDMSAKRDFLGGLSGKVTITVEDKWDETYPVIRSKTGAAKEQVNKLIMVHDSRLPKTFDSTPDFILALELLKTLSIGMPK
ncbi:MAG: hypothetical protein AB1810_00205 [Pseudomonadota bacterium]